MALPKFIALKLTTNQNYLYYVARDTEGNRGVFRFSGGSAISPYSKFEVEVAESETNDGLVHIRCCHSNKYWVKSERSNRVVAAINCRQESISQQFCTLFKPEISSRNYKTVVRFVHARTNTYLGTDSEFRLIAGIEKNHGSWFSVVDWHTLVVLPSYVAFKDDKGRYLSVNWIESGSYLQFSSTDIGDETVGNEIFYNKDGSIRIKSNLNGMFWRRSPYWIRPDADDDSGNDPDTWFSIVKVNDKTIALRNLGNQQFCRSLAADWKEDCLHASGNTINRSAQLEVEEPIISRKIMDVRYRINEARIFGQSSIVLGSGHATNRSEKSVHHEILFSNTLTESSTWNNSFSLQLGEETTIQTRLPYIVDEEVKISAELARAWSWGRKKEKTNKLDNRWSSEVPKQTRLTVRYIATEGTCEVPFSYTQLDTLTNGKQVTYRKDDGVYTGVNTFNFDYETEEKPID